jgi:two-component system chemotaxis response regulator CheY
MAILIVDDEASTRNALRDLLTQLGHKTVLEARNGEDALKVAEAEKNRIRLIVADWEMPYMDGITLLERIATIRELDLAPFLLITSDLPRSQLVELQARTSRLDAFLIKPFRMSALAQAMSAAQAHRASLRRKLVAFCASGSVPERLAAALQSTEAARQWDPLITVRTLSELEQAVRSCAGALGAIVVIPGVPGSSAPGGEDASAWLAAFGRTPLGGATSVICASRDPAAIFPLRTLCQVFLAPEGDWPGTLARVRRKQESSLDLELRFQELKGWLQAKKPEDARRSCERILALDELSSEANSTLGDLLDEQGQKADAIARYWAALECNPCLPKPYIRLLDALAPSSPESARAARLAETHCPQNPDVLCAAARARRAAGDAADCQRLARRILELNPNHAGAKSLLA